MRYNTGPQVVDVVTAEQCRRNFLDALQDYHHPVWVPLMRGITRILSKHHDECACGVCTQYQAELDNAAARKQRVLKKQLQEQERRNKKNYAIVDYSNTPWACGVADCNRAVHARKRCKMHYKRFLRHEQPARKTNVNVGKQCSDAGCDRDAQIRGMCRMHYKRWHRRLDKTVQV